MIIMQQLVGKLIKDNEGEWIIRLNQYNNVGFNIHPYQRDMEGLIENEYYFFSIEVYGGPNEYYATGLQKINEAKK